MKPAPGGKHLEKALEGAGARRACATLGVRDGGAAALRVARFLAGNKRGARVEVVEPDPLTLSTVVSLAHAAGTAESIAPACFAPDEWSRPRRANPSVSSRRVSFVSCSRCVSFCLRASSKRLLCAPRCVFESASCLPPSDDPRGTPRRRRDADDPRGTPRRRRDADDPRGAPRRRRDASSNDPPSTSLKLWRRSTDRDLGNAGSTPGRSRRRD